MDLQRPGRALSLDARAVADLAREIDALARGARLIEIVALPPADVVLVLERSAAVSAPSTERVPPLRVRLSADPEAPRLHVQQGRTVRHEGPLGPFFRRISEELAGATFASLTPVAGDRIVLAELRDAPVGERRALVLELFGRHANLVLLGRGDVVVDLLVPPPAGKQGARLERGKAWSAPPRTKTNAPPDEASDPFAAFRELAQRSSSAPGTPGASSAPASSKAPNASSSSTRATIAPLSQLVEDALGAQALAARESRERARVLERLTRRLERARSLVHGLEQRLESSRGFERVREDGEILKAHLHELPRGQKSVELDDFFAGEGAKRTIALDPKLSPHENLARTFERAKKLERALGAVEGELALAREKAALVEEFVARARADEPEPAETLETEAIERGALDPVQATVEEKQREPAVRLPYKPYRALRGSEIRVGRTAADNDALTFRHARGSDLWLHTADTPGSHVVLRMEQRDKEPDPDELIDAAHLAVHFSPLRGATRARVHVARQKEVHKPRGAKAGLVTLSGGRILELRLQPERLQRLLGTHRAPES